MEILNIKNLEKIYTTKFGKSKVVALKDVNFKVSKGEFIAIMGESGSGKTTLLNIVAALDKPTAGQILIDNINLLNIGDNKLSEFRRDKLGFVFQEFNLLDTLNSKENIALPLVLSRVNPKQIDSLVLEVSKKLKIESLLNKYPYELSGGQKQRVSVARAIINKPTILLADEPTGALDSKSSDTLLQQFEKVNRENQTILMVTHSVKAASVASRVMFIKDGKIYHEIYKGDSTKSQFYTKISETLNFLEKEGE